MAANRSFPTTVTHPADISGADYADDVASEGAALWNRVIDFLENVAGTNTITATAGVTITGYAKGMGFRLIPANTNTGAVTINVDSLGAKNLTDPAGNALTSGKLVAGQAYSIWYDGTVFRCDTLPAFVATQTGQLIIAHSAANGTDGGTATSGSEQTYPLSATLRNTIPGASVDLSTEQFTLPAGEYEGEFSATVFDVDAVMFRLYNVTDAAYVTDAVFLNGRAGSASDYSVIHGKIALTLTAAKTFKIVYTVQTTNTTDGLGEDSTLYSSTEGYGFISLRATSPSAAANAGWTTVSKANDEARASTTTLTDDSTLAFPVQANKKYRFRAKIFYDTPTAADFKFDVNGPASPTLVQIETKTIAPGATALSNIALKTAFAFSAVSVTETSGTNGMIEAEGIVHNGANAGTVAFRWAQNTSNGSNTTVRAGSYIEYSEA